MRLLAALTVTIGLMASPAGAGTKSSCTRALDSADRISVLYGQFADAVSDHISSAPIDANIAEMGASYKALGDKAGELAPKIAAERRKYQRYSAACRR